MTRQFFIILSLLIASNALAQSGRESTDLLNDTLPSKPHFNVESAWDYVHLMTEGHSFWKTEGDSVQASLIRLLNHTTSPYDSVRLQLDNMEFQSIHVGLEKTLLRDTIHIRWLNDSSFIIDSIGWSLNLLLKEEKQLQYPIDFSAIAFSDSILDGNETVDSTLFLPDTISISVIDTSALETLHLPLYQYDDARVFPPINGHTTYDNLQVLTNPGYLVFTDTISRWLAHEESPFFHLNGAYQLDSLQVAVETLIHYNERRDSTILIINDLYGNKSPFWISNGSNNSHRFWVKNYKNDSITLWIGNPASNEISLLLEDDIDVNRLMAEEVDHLPKHLHEPDRKLAKISLIEPDPFYWDYEFSSAFSFNQTYLSNWSKGGESSLTTMLDVMGSAIYNNKDANTQWINSARLKYGTLLTNENGLRKNNDLFEINSKFNRNASGKIGLSASFYLKNQIAKGYNYPNDSVVVSKFLNPVSLTIGLGAEYKPWKNTTLNMAPLSYKNTFVADTARIDQTKHGIDKDKRSKQELGTQIVLTNKISPMEDLDITNHLRLFSNYLNNPGNIDIDWEMMLDKKINWFFTIRLNLHLIYDDDIRFNLLDSDDQPILNLDGTQKKVAKAQFKEFVGLSLLFKF